MLPWFVILVDITKSFIVILNFAMCDGFMVIECVNAEYTQNEKSIDAPNCLLDSRTCERLKSVKI